jgi:hypothetical protein
LNEQAVQTPLRRLWSRRWVRRLTYLLAGGAVLLQTGSWLLEQPATTAWVVRKLDAYSREHTGQSLEIRRIKVGPWAGYLLLEDVAWGGDLLRIRRVELQADPASLLAGRPHILSARLTEPVARISEARLATIHLKPRPETHAAKPQIRLDHLAIEGAEVVVEPPTYGVPALKAAFSAKGVGRGPNDLRLDLATTALQVEGPQGLEHGKLELGADLSEPLVTLRHLAVRLDRTQLRAQGRLEPERKSADLQVGGRIDLAQLAGHAHLPAPRPSGLVTLEAHLGGQVASPRWTVRARGSDLHVGPPGLKNGELDLSASGQGERAEVRRLLWQSAQGRLEAEGAWHRREGFKGRVTGSGLDLAPLAAWLRAPQLAVPRFAFKGAFAVSGPPEGWADPQRWSVQGQGQASDAAGPAGTFSLDLTKGAATAQLQGLRLGDLTADGQAQAALSRKGLSRLQAEGEATLKVESVAHTLDAWKIVTLPMGGTVRASAQVAWTPKDGLTLDGGVAVQSPRWELETADDLNAKVRIRRDQIWVEDILLHDRGGLGTGELWLTWGPVPKGAVQMESCYRATRIPVEGGLRAAGLTDEDLGVFLRGTASAWARLSGPLHALRLTGGARLESGSLGTAAEGDQPSPFRIAIPAAEGSLDLDLTTLRMRLTDLHLAGAPDELHGRSGPLDLRGQLDMDLDRGEWWGQVKGLFDSAALEWPGPRLTAKLEAGVQGPMTVPFGPLHLPHAWVKVQDGGIELEDISVGGFRASLDFLGPKFSLSASHKGRTEPLFTLEARSDRGELAADAHLRFLPYTLDTPELSRRLTGNALEDLRLDLEAKGRWDGENLRWQGRFHELVGVFQAFTLGQTRKSEVWGDAAGARLDLVLDGHQRGALSPEGTPLPGASVHLSGILPFSTRTPMALHTQGRMEMSALKSVADALLDVEEGSLLKELKPEGIGSFDLNARGTYPEPFVDGRIDMEQARLRVGEVEDLRDLTVHLVLKDRTVSLPADHPLTATLNQGRVEASGELRWQTGGLERYAFQGRLQDFQIQDPPGLEGLLARGSAEATLTGDANGGLLKGSILTDALAYQTDIKLTELLYQSALADTGSGSLAAPDDPLDTIRLDLDVKMNRPWEVDTNLAKLEGSPDGAFKILGTLAHPGLRGRMSLAPGGRITNLLPAGDVVLIRGAIDFSDPAVLNPRLDLEGEVQVPGYTVTLGITGTLASLDWNLRSVPSLSKNDIVAVLINPDYAQNIGTGPSTGSQTAVSSGAASAGTGLLTTLALAEFQERLRKTLSLDRFNVSVRSGTEGTSETDVTLGKRVNLFGWRLPFVVSQKRRRDQITTSGQVEWRFGGFTLQLGGSQTSNTPISPSGEIRTTWSPKP